MRNQPNMLAVSCLLAACWLAGCGLAARAPQPENLAPIDAWVADDMMHLTSRTEPANSSIYDPLEQQISLAAAGNETAAFQLVIDAGSAPLTSICVRVSDLNGPAGSRIAGRDVSVFRLWPGRAESFPAWHVRLADEPPQPMFIYDAMIPSDAPVNGQPYSLQAGERLALWIDLRVGPDVLAGNYRGTVTVSAADRQHWTASIVLKVPDLVLPASNPFLAIGSFDHDVLFGEFIQRDGRPFKPPHLDRANPDVRRGLAVVRQMMQLARQHRLDLVDLRLRPLLKRDTDGKVLLHWEDYDAVAQPYLDGSAFDDGMGCRAWPIPFSGDWPDPAQYGGPDSNEYARTASQIIAAAVGHLAQTPGVAERLLLWPGRPGLGADELGRLANLARSAGFDGAILAHLGPQQLVEAGFDRNLVDAFAPSAQDLEPADRLPDRAGQPLAGLWLCPGKLPYLPNLGALACPADARALAWLAMKYGCAGLLLEDVLNWPADPSHPPLDERTRLFYPGTVAGMDGVLASVRLKHLRRGLQDAAYLRLLKQRLRDDAASGALACMVRYAGLDACGDDPLDPHLSGWVRDGQAFQQAQRLLAIELLAATHPGTVTGRELAAVRAGWQGMRERHQAARVEQVRLNLRPLGRDNMLRATVQVDLHNPLAQPQTAAVELGRLPDGWSASADKATLELPPGAHGVAEVSADGNFVPSTADAKLRLPLTVTIQGQAPKEISACVPFVVARPVGGAPKIDGSLEDWPMLPGNSAGDFVPLGRRGLKPNALSERQTLAFVLNDGKNLYAAFRCQEPNVAGMTARSANTVQFEDSLACGEDLVELVLDPGLLARRPEDLYHVVVKCNGIHLARRGAGPASQPWAVEAKVAVERFEGLWTVELSLPLSAFGDRSESEFWGVNFARTSTQGAEASSWSAARRHFYDVRTLGTMVLVRQKDN